MSKYTDKDDFTERHTSTMERIRDVFKALDGKIPETVKGFGFIGVIFGYSGPSAQDKVDAKKIQEKMEVLLNQLEKTTNIIEAFDEKQRKTSSLPAEVKTSYKALLEWAKLVEEKQQPRDLLAKLDERITRLESAINRETFGGVHQIERDVDRLATLVQITKKKANGVL